MKPIYCFLFLNIICLSSCKEHKKLPGVGTKILMPTEIRIYSPFGTDTSRRFLTDYNKFKIYTLINTGCVTCLEKLKGWDKFQAENPDLSKVTIIPVCYARDSFEMLKYLFDTRRIPSMHLPLVLDLQDSFIKLNRTLIRTGDFTALTDADDRIVVPGNPLDNEKVKNRFLEAVRNAE